MGALVDLTGQTFGRLKVIGRAGQYGKHGHFMATWLCRCKCDAEVVVTSGNLRSGNTKSCGCLRREEMSRAMRSAWAMLKEDKQ